MAQRIDVTVAGLPRPDPPSGEFAEPTTENVGPATTVTGSTLSNITAVMNVANANGGIVSGRFLANIITSQPGQVFIAEDCDLTGAFNSIEGWWGTGGAPADDVRIILRRCYIHNCEANGLVGVNIEAYDCHFEFNGDDFKPFGNNRIHHSLLHNLHSIGGDPHGDNIQCFAGDDIEIDWNSIDGHHDNGAISSSVLQISDGGPITNFRMHHNWVGGGAYTLRGADAHAGDAAGLTFRNNRHRRDYGFGPITGMGSFNGGLTVSDYDSSNVWEDDGTPVSGG